MKVTEFNSKSNFEKLLAGLVQGNDVSNFCVYKKEKSINFLFGEWNVTLYDNGKWEIT